MDNIVFEKIWMDSCEDFFEVRVTAKNDNVMMTSSGYATSAEIRKLQQGVTDVLKRPFSVEFDNRYDNRVRLSFSPDICGIIAISIHMKTSGYANSSDSAFFTVTTEVALLDRFSQKLNRMIEGDVGAIAQLVDDAA